MLHSTKSDRATQSKTEGHGRKTITQQSTGFGFPNNFVLSSIDVTLSE